MNVLDFGDQMSIPISRARCLLMTLCCVVLENRTEGGIQRIEDHLNENGGIHVVLI